MQSRLKLNWKKISCMPIGSLIPQEISEDSVARKIKWVKEIKVLGICYTSDITKVTDFNISKK